MKGDHVGRGITDHASTDVVWDFTLPDGHHRDRSAGGQPVRFVVTAGVVADVVEITEDEWHGAEALQAGTRPT